MGFRTVFVAHSSAANCSTHTLDVWSGPRPVVRIPTADGGWAVFGEHTIEWEQIEISPCRSIDEFTEW
jgi:hypothetical protein